MEERDVSLLWILSNGTCRENTRIEILDKEIVLIIKIL